MKEIIVAVVLYKNKILLLKRNANKHFDPGKWEFVSGFINGEKSLQNFARERVIFETGLDIQYVKEGKSFKVQDQYGEWLIHSFSFSSTSDKVQLKDDHETYRWIFANELSKFDTVHQLSKNLTALNL